MKFYVSGLASLMLCLFLIGCGVPQEEYNAVIAERDTALSQVKSLQRELEGNEIIMQEIRKDLSDVRAELNIAEMELRTAKEELENYKATGVKVHSNIQPPYGLGPYSSGEVNLVNNRRAINPTWRELCDFLVEDPTDEDYYSAYHACGEFAQDLHNNAEASGIKVAFVVIHFKDKFRSRPSESHALNAFYTTDKGLVYIDCTGEGSSGDIGIVHVTLSFWGEDPDFEYSVEWDKVAYVKRGKGLGYVSIAPGISLDYSFYQTQWMKWQFYLNALEGYSREVNAYNSNVAPHGITLFLDRPEYAEAMDWYNRLERRKKELLEQLATLGPCAWEPTNDIVESIEIYW